MIFATSVILSASLSLAQSTLDNLPKCPPSQDREKFLMSLHLECPEGKEKDAGLCYNPCPEGYKGVGPVCWKGIKSHPRGVGTLMIHKCPENTLDADGFCFKPCPDHYIATSSFNFSEKPLRRCVPDQHFFNCQF